MPIILRAFQDFPIMQADGSFIQTPFATVAVIDDAGNQLSQLNISASEVEGLSAGVTLRLVEADAPHGLDVSVDHAEMISPAKL